MFLDQIRSLRKLLMSICQIMNLKNIRCPRPLRASPSNISVRRFSCPTLAPSIPPIFHSSSSLRRLQPLQRPPPLLSIHCARLAVPRPAPAATRSPRPAPRAGPGQPRPHRLRLRTSIKAFQGTLLVRCFDFRPVSAHSAIHCIGHRRLGSWCFDALTMF
jgi:hypothetical protein